MTIKAYKKKYKICVDDNGKTIYAGDTVEVLLPWVKLFMQVIL